MNIGVGDTRGKLTDSELKGSRGSKEQKKAEYLGSVSDGQSFKGYMKRSVGDGRKRDSNSL